MIGDKDASPPPGADILKEGFSSAGARGWTRWTGPPSGRVSSHARFRIFFFPHAGGTSSDYRIWATHFPPDVDVCPLLYPARGNRWNEAALTAMPELVAHLTRDLLALLDVPFAFFGHSMGALVAYEFARHLRDRGATLPRHLFVSAARAPHVPDVGPPMSALPDAAFLEQMKSLNGFPRELRDNHEFLQLVLPTLRADMALCDGYSYDAGDPLPCPITVFGGRDDRRVTRAQLTSWAVHTAGRFRVRFYPGDHFFLAGARSQVIRAMLADLALGRP